MKTLYVAEVDGWTYDPGTRSVVPLKVLYRQATAEELVEVVWEAYGVDLRASRKEKAGKVAT